MGRKKRSWESNALVMRMIAKLYNELSERCIKDRPKHYDGLSYQDIFQETVLFVSCDKCAIELINDKNKFIEYFMYRFRVTQFKTIHEYRRLNKTEYADYKQASAQEEEE